jgi:aspartate racemase
MLKKEPKRCLGIVGGAGPLASAEFLKTIYEYSVKDRLEQETPVVMMYSDPTIPDRTDAFLRGDADVVLKLLIDALRSLLRSGATEIVICCMTMHHLLPRLPCELQTRVVSMLDVIFDNLASKRAKHLVFCSNGTRKFQLFERHPQWERFKDDLLFPDEQDQQRIHYEIIYQLKRSLEVGCFAAQVESLLTKYQVDSLIAGCTEIHIIGKYLAAKAARQRAPGCVDPLDILARRLAGGSL